MSANRIRNAPRVLHKAYCVFFLFLLTGCLPRAAATPFIPPTHAQDAPTEAVRAAFASPTAVEIALPTATATLPPTPTPEEPTITPTPACSPSLRYLDDLSYPDGTLVSPGQPVPKRWQVENNGSCDWGSGYRLKLIGGYPLGVFGEVALYPTRAGMQAVIEINFIAPSERGIYRTAWQAFDAEALPFGDVIYMEIEVK